MKQRDCRRIGDVGTYRAYALGFALFTDQEILTAAGIAPPVGNPQTVTTVIGPYTGYIDSYRCQADVGVQGGLAGSDGVLDNNDFIVFIDQFFNGPASCR